MVSVTTWPGTALERERRPGDLLFDRPTAWRAEAAMALDLDGDELLAALSPGASYPAVLRSVAAALPPHASVIVDLGAGAGGASEWLRFATGATVIAVEVAAGACAAARRCFPNLHVMRSRAATTGLAASSCDAVTMCGMLSLIDDAAPVLAEARRLLRPAGVLAIADLFAFGHEDIRSEPNTFRTMPSLAQLLHDHGFELTEMGLGSTAPRSDWVQTSSRIDDWIDARYRRHPSFTAWEDDRNHLDAHIRRGDLIGGGVVASMIAGSS